MMLVGNRIAKDSLGMILNGCHHIGRAFVVNSGYERSFTSDAGHETRRTLIFGANTDVGKSLLVAGLCRSSAVHDGVKTGYVKPVQAGLPGDEDIVKLYGEGNVVSETLHTFPDHPCSPHLAAFLSDTEVSGGGARRGAMDGAKRRLERHTHILTANHLLPTFRFFIALLAPRTASLISSDKLVGGCSKGKGKMGGLQETLHRDRGGRSEPRTCLEGGRWQHLAQKGWGGNGVVLRTAGRHVQRGQERC